MSPGQEPIERILVGLKPTPWAGTVYRVVLGETLPERENTRGARWNPPDDVPAIYTSLMAATAIAEVEYNLQLQRIPLRREVRKTLYRIDVQLAAVVDLAPALPALERIGVGRAELFADDMRVSQAIGRFVTFLDCDGLLVPSARADGLNLVVYPNRARADTYRFEPRNPEVL